MLKRRKKKTSILKRRFKTIISQNKSHQNSTGSKGRINQEPLVNKKNISNKCLEKTCHIIEIVYILSLSSSLLYFFKRKPQTTVSQNEPHQNFTGSKNQTNQGPSMKKENIAIKCLKKIYRIIEIVYTLSFFLFLVYFVIGCFIHDNRSDNDLIMKQIKEEISKSGEITSIIVDDIHGFGNNSIIATTRTIDYDIGVETNKLVILDLVENQFLHNIHDPFGLKSSYKTTLSYSIDVDNSVPSPKVEYILNIDDDAAKEILVRYNYFGSQYGAYSPAIFKYSYEKEQYQLIGTYPVCGKLNLATYSDDSVIVGFSTQIIETPFFYNDDNISIPRGMKCTHENIEFNLPEYSMTSCRSYWATGFWGTVLVVLQWDWQNTQDYWQPPSTEYYINIYQPMYDSEDESIRWNIIFSEYCDESVDIWNQNSIEAFICQKFGKEISILAPTE